MSRLVEMRLPAPFVIERASPTGAELAYGFREGWLSRKDVVEVALAKYKADVVLSPPEEELALLLPDDLDRVDDVVSVLEFSDEPVEQRERLWLFLALAWLLDHRSDYEDPLGVIEQLYADFEYPEEIRSLVRFIPLGPGDVPGIEGIERRWHDYVERVGLEYRQRTRLS
jgi:hypothetical protein